MTAATNGDPTASKLAVAMLAPPWIPIPPPAYGGIEQVVDLLSAELVRRGHSVTLFASPGSHSQATVAPMLDQARPEAIQMSIFEADHVARAFHEVDEAAEQGTPFDIVHDHSGFTAFAFADRLRTPLVHTLHGPFTEETAAFYNHHGANAAAIALSEYQRSQAPPRLHVPAVVPNPIVVDDFPFRAEKENFLLWIGRINDDKGPQRAIAAAKQAGVPIVLAGPVQPGQEEFFQREVEPHLDGDAARYIGEVGGEEKHEVFANATAVLMPIRWAEPFGLVMTEAMACGTPVIAYPEGSACEIVIEGETGFLVDDEEAMGRAVRELSAIDPERCRESALERYDVKAVASAHERAYADVIAEAEAPAREGSRAPLE